MSGARQMPMRALILAVAIGAVALLLRVRLLDRGLGHDEITTAMYYIDGVSLRQTISTYHAFSNHIAYSVLAGWSQVVIGQGEVGLRFPALLLGLAAPLALYRLGAVVLGRWPAALAAALLAVSPVHVFYSATARGYSGLVLLSVISSWLFLRLLASPSRRLVIAYAMVSAAAVYFHLYAGLVLLVQVLMIALLVLGRAWGLAEGMPSAPSLRAAAVGILGAAILGALLYAPVIESIVRNALSRGRGAPQPGLPVEILRIFGVGYIPLVVWLLGLLAAIGMLYLARQRPLFALYSTLLLAVPLALTMLARPFDLYPRFFVYWLPFYLLAAAAGVRALWRVPVARILSPALALLLLLSFAADSWTGVAEGGYRGVLGEIQRGTEEGYRDTLTEMRRGAETTTAFVAIGGAVRLFEYYSDRPVQTPRSVDEFHRIASESPAVAVGYYRSQEYPVDNAIAEFLAEQGAEVWRRSDGEFIVYRYCPLASTAP